MKWIVFIQDVGKMESLTWPDFTDNGWCITLLNGKLYFYEGWWFALPALK